MKKNQAHDDEKTLALKFANYKKVVIKTCLVANKVA